MFDLDYDDKPITFGAIMLAMVGKNVPDADEIDKAIADLEAAILEEEERLQEEIDKKNQSTMIGIELLRIGA